MGRRRPPQKPSPYASKEKTVSSHQLEQCYSLSHKIVNELEKFAEASHKSSSLHPALTHAKICYKMIESIQPTHNTEHFDVSTKILNDTLHQASSLTSQLAKYPHKTEDFHIFFRDVRSLKKHLDDLVHISIHSHR